MKENTENQASAVEINLQELMLLYLRKWWILVICFVLGAALMFTYTKLFVTPMYRASIAFYINNSRGETESDYLSSADLNASSWLVNGYMDIVRRRPVLEAAAEKLDGDYTAGQIGAMLSTKKVESTQIFQVYVTHFDPVEAARIAEAMGDAVPEAATEIIKGSSATPIDKKVSIPGSPISPSYFRNMLVGGMIGVFVAILFVSIRFLRDTRIRDEEELLMLFNLPVLGRIPDFEQENMTSANEHVKKLAAKEEEDQ